MVQRGKRKSGDGQEKHNCQRVTALAKSQRESTKKRRKYKNPMTDRLHHWHKIKTRA
jgi:hypothetical protein